MGRKSKSGSRQKNGSSLGPSITYFFIALACSVLAGTLFFTKEMTPAIDLLAAAAAPSPPTTTVPIISDSGSMTTTPEATTLASQESLGFFTDIPDATWIRYKERFQWTQPNYDDGNRQQFERFSRYSNWFWATNFEPEFTCPHEFRLGQLGDGGKWVCDPHRIPPESCLIYSIGSNGNFQFEVESFKHVSKSCEIHTFDLIRAARHKDFAVEAAKVGVHFHHWGLGPKAPGMPKMKTFKEMIVELKHERKTIDVMKIDCERCEYQQFRQWLQDWNELGMTVRQVLLEIHNSELPHVVNLFREFQQAGYVMFHKEANYINEGNAIEAAFLLLSRDFQKPYSEK